MKMVCFDLGGVLLEILHDVDQRLNLCDAGRRGSTLPHDVKDTLLRFNEEYQRGTYDWSEVRTKLSQVTAEHGFMETDWDQIEEGIIVGPKPDASEVVEFCLGKGFELGILSNTCELHVNQFERYAFFEAFPKERRVYSHREKVLKPEASAFHCFEQRIGLQGESIIFFDDTMENVEAAKELGWQAFPISRGQPVLPQVIQALGGFEQNDN